MKIYFKLIKLEELGRKAMRRVYIKSLTVDIV